LGGQWPALYSDEKMLPLEWPRGRRQPHGHIESEHGSSTGERGERDLAPHPLASIPQMCRPSQAPGVNVAAFVNSSNALDGNFKSIPGPSSMTWTITCGLSGNVARRTVILPALVYSMAFLS
jgi:hypothetical protein